MLSVLNTIDTGHEDMVHDAELDYYGVRLATCSSDHSVKVYDVKDGTHTLVADLKGHVGPVWQIAWAHPKFGTILASCSYDRKVIIWQENREWCKLHEYGNHNSSVNAIAWAPMEFGLTLACGSADGSISFITSNAVDSWESKKIKNAHMVGCNAVSWCPSTAESPFGNDEPTVQRLASGGCDNLVKIWKLEGDGWVEESKLEAHSDWVRDVAWSPSIGNVGSTIASCSQDRRVIVWTSTDNYATWTPKVLHTFDDVVWSVSWSLLGDLLSVSGGDNKVSLWKETLEQKWQCISEVNKGQSEKRNL